MHSSLNRRGRSFGVPPSPGGWSDALRPSEDPTVMNDLDPSPVKQLHIPKALDGHSIVEISHLRPVASYNWTDRESPTIIVPGT